MGLLDRFKRKGRGALDEPRFPTRGPQPEFGGETQTAPAPAVPTSFASSSLKAEMDLVLSQIENLRMQYEAISARLQNIEKLVAEIRSFCR